MTSTKILLLLLALSIASTGLAAEVHWISSSDGNWSDGSNWSTGMPPSSGDSVVIDNPGTYAVTLDEDADILSLSLGAGSGQQILEISGQQLQLDGVSSIGSYGALNLSNGLLTGSGSVSLSGVLTINSGNSIDVDVACSGTINVYHQNNTFSGQMTTTETSLLNLDIIQNANPQITFATGFTNHGNI
ncbi:MAG: hypothetical protein GY780_09605, partial [bacterium]|nr:hypothetical protein [bacterium]